MRSQTMLDSFVKRTNPNLASLALITIRILLGIQFLVGGLSKMGDWSAKGYLLASTGPFASWFISMAGNPMIDFLNAWGQLAIGLGLIVGLLVRPASFFAAILMVLYYFAQFVDNTTHGLVDFHIVYMVIFVLFAGGGIGHVFGLDGLIFANLRNKNTLVKVLFG